MTKTVTRSNNFCRNGNFSLGAIYATQLGKSNTTF